MPIDIQPYLGRQLSCGVCDQAHVVPTECCVVAQDAIARALPDFIERRFSARRVLVLADEITREVAGEEVLSSLRAAGIPHVAMHLIQGHGPSGRPGCDDETLAEVGARVAEAAVDVVVAVGSGTVNDIAKVSAALNELPYLAVPTAASMNGYTSGIASILSGGVKRTQPFPPTVGVFADPRIVAAAPLDMSQAGLGDLLSKSVCGADWRLAHRLTDAYWCSLPGTIVHAAEEASIASAAAIGQARPEGVATLLEALLLSGVSMVAAGSSSPASGAEHLLSHLWDMRRHLDGRPLNHHGAQVGVGTIVTATLYEQLLAYPVESRVDPERLAAQRPSWAEERARLAKSHGPLHDEIAACLIQKHREGDEHASFVRGALSIWGELRDELATIVRPAAQIRAALAAAGAPLTVAELGIDEVEARETFRTARDIRARYTILDLVSDLGLMDELADGVLDASGILA